MDTSEFFNKNEGNVPQHCNNNSDSLYQRIFLGGKVIEQEKQKAGFEWFEFT